MNTPRRVWIWLLVAVVLIAIGTGTALWRQQVNFGEHDKLDQRACVLSLETRALVADVLHAFEPVMGINPDVVATLNRLALRADALVVHTQKLCRES